MFFYMDKKILIGFILKDIKELELIVKGMHEMDKIPGVVQELIISKTENILGYFHSLKDDACDGEKKEENSLPIAKAPKLEAPAPIPPVLTVTPNEKEETTVTSPQKEETTVISQKKEPEKEINKGASNEASNGANTGTTTNEKFKPQTPSLHAVVSTGKKAESRFVHSLRKAINVNDRYRYLRELFRGNIELMNQVVEKLDTMETLSEAMDYVQREFSWDPQSETVADFYSLLENRFS